jgi:CRP/FNR family transcriptional regulator
MGFDKISIFKQTELLRDLDDNIVRSLASHSIEKRLGRDEILFVGGEPAKGIYVIESGAVRAYRSSPEGREQIIHIERAVTTIAEVPVFDNGNYPSTVAGEEPTVLHFLSKEDVMKAAVEHPAIALAAARLMASRLRKCAELVETLSLREVGQRLASWLITEARSQGIKSRDGVRLQLQLTHSQLAARIGTVREVVTRTLIRLEDNGMIIHKDREIIIPDLAALETYAA